MTTSVEAHHTRTTGMPTYTPGHYYTGLTPPYSVNTSGVISLAPRPLPGAVYSLSKGSGVFPTYEYQSISSYSSTRVVTRHAHHARSDTLCDTSEASQLCQNGIRLYN
jgi:hypothetical protein